MACCRSHLQTRRPHPAAQPGPRPAQRPGGGAGGVRVGGVPAPQLRPRHRRGHQRRHQRSVAVSSPSGCTVSPPARCCSELHRLAAAPVDGGQDDGGAGERGPDVRPGRQEGVHRPQVQCSTVRSAVQYSTVTALCVQELRQDPPHRGVQPPPAAPQLQPRLEHLRASAARQPPVRGQMSQ